MRIGLGLFIGNSQKAGPPADVTAPTVVITLSDYAFKTGDTATITFTFSEAPTSFAEADVTAPNGSLTSFGVTGDPLIYTAIFTPTASVTDATNVITVGTSWTDAAGNPPAGSTTSANYTVDTTAPTVVITCAQASPSATTPLNFTFTFSESVTGFEVGDITAVDSAGTALIKANFAGSGAVYTCDITPTGMSVITVDVAGSVCVDGAGNANSAATQFSFTSTAPFLDAFTRGDGAIGSIWTGATWTIASNAALNTPTVGAELTTNPGFEGTYEDEAGGGGGTIMLAPNWDNSACETNGTDTLNESATAHGGSKSQQINADATNEGVITAANVFAAKNWYQLSTWFNITSGAAVARDENNDLILLSLTTGSWVQLLGTFRSAGAYKVRVLSNGGASNFLVDDISAKQITLSTLFATLPSVGVSNVTARVVISANPTQKQAGLVVNMDNVTTPANFVIAYLYRDYAGNCIARLDKCVAGTYTNLINAVVTFDATHTLKVIKDGDNYSLWYSLTGSSQVGATQVITGMNGTIHGLFSTNSTPKFDNYQINPT